METSCTSLVLTEGLRELSTERREALEDLWAAASSVTEGLCSEVDGRRRSMRCIDFAVLPALAGDHACTPQELRDVVATDWVRDVVEVSDRVRTALAKSDSVNLRLGLWDRSHLRMQGADPDYLGRAAGTRAHFLLPRESDEFAPYFA